MFPPKNQGTVTQSNNISFFLHLCIPDTKTHNLGGVVWLNKCAFLTLSYQPDSEFDIIIINEGIL